MCSKASQPEACQQQVAACFSEAAPEQKQDGNFLKDSEHIKDGPVRKYLDGRNSGLYKADPRQENTIKLLQQLYDQLKKVHISHKRPSGLTTTEHIGTENSRHSW